MSIPTSGCALEALLEVSQAEVAVHHADDGAPVASVAPDAGQADVSEPTSFIAPADGS
jgi:hypothetical protein